MPIYFVDNSVFKIVIWECNQRLYGWKFCFTVICQVSLCKTICDDKPYDLPPNDINTVIRNCLHTVTVYCTVCPGISVRKLRIITVSPILIHFC